MYFVEQKTMHTNLKVATPPRRVLGEIDKTSSILRDLLNGDFSNIHVNDEGIFDEMKEFIRRVNGEESDGIGATGEDGLACLELLLTAQKIGMAQR